MVLSSGGKSFRPIRSWELPFDPVVQKCEYSGFAGSNCKIHNKIQSLKSGFSRFFKSSTPSGYNLPNRLRRQVRFQVTLIMLTPLSLDRLLQKIYPSEFCSRRSNFQGRSSRDGLTRKSRSFLGSICRNGHTMIVIADHLAFLSTKRNFTCPHGISESVSFSVRFERCRRTRLGRIHCSWPFVQIPVDAGKVPEFKFFFH